VKTKLARWIWFFGYAKHEGGNERTGFYEYENPSKELVDSYMGFQKNNEQVLKDLCAGEKYKNVRFHMNGKETNQVELFDGCDYVNLQYPNIDYSMRKMGYAGIDNPRFKNPTPSVEEAKQN
jgi:hypothetical protein